ncbi:MAG: hypothetical protein PHQ89_04680 [Bacilli bacterium]|nr:hypothetical protein [Bacilli bacterium]
MTKNVNMTMNLNDVEMFEEQESQDIIEFIESKKALKTLENIKKGKEKDISFDDFKKILDSRDFV